MAYFFVFTILPAFSICLLHAEWGGSKSQCCEARQSNTGSLSAELCPSMPYIGVTEPAEAEISVMALGNPDDNASRPVAGDVQWSSGACVTDLIIPEQAGTR